MILSILLLLSPSWVQLFPTTLFSISLSLFSSQVPNQGSSERRERKYAFRLWWWSVMKDTTWKNLSLEEKIIWKLILKNLNGRGEMHDFGSKQGEVSLVTNFRFHKIWGISWLVEEILACEEWPCPTQLVCRWRAHLLLCRKSLFPHNSYVLFDLQTLQSKAAKRADVCRSARWPSWHYVSIIYSEYWEF